MESGSGLMTPTNSTTSPPTTTVTTGSMTSSARTSPPNGILDILSMPPVYLGLSGAVLLIIIILCFVCIGVCIICSTKKGNKKKNKISDSKVEWTEEGQVQLLSIADMAGVQEQTGSKSNPIQDTPVAGEDAKDEDKRVVTVATFGFPALSIQPPATSLESVETEKKGESDDKRPASEEKGNVEHSTADATKSATPSETVDTVVSGNSVKPTDAIIDPGITQVVVAEKEGKVATSQAQSEEDKVTGSASKVTAPQEVKLDLPIELDMESFILSTEAIEKALGLDFKTLESTQL